MEINPKAHHKAGPTLALKSQIIMTIYLRAAQMSVWERNR